MKLFFSLAIFVFLSQLTLAQSPIEGDDLIQLISLRKGNDKVNALENYIGGNIEAKGVSITFDQNVVIRIDLYNSNNPFFQNTTPFAGKLPKGLDFSQTIFKAKATLGEGFEEDGEPANALTIIRQFPLNELDAVKISVDFRKGKMSMVSIIYQQGEAEKAEDAEAVKEGEVVIRGDDYFFMIKKNIYNKEVEKFLSTLGFVDYGDKSIKMFIKKGVALHFNQANQIKKISFFGGGQSTTKKPETYSPFTGKMPYNLKFTDTRDIVKQKAGTPKLEEGNKISFFDSGCQVDVVFGSNTIIEVSIGIPEEQKKTETENK